MLKLGILTKQIPVYLSIFNFRMLIESFKYTANVNRQTTDKLLFSDAIITDENM